MLRVLPVLPLTLFAGCGVAGTQFHPGIAAEVGDQTITTRHVDQVTEGYCEAVEEVSKGQAQSGGQTEPMRYLARLFATDLVERAAVEQLAEEYDVEPTASYKDTLTQLEPEIAELSEDQQEAVREVVGARAYNQDVLAQIGAASLADQGTDDAAAEEQQAEGEKVLAAWLKDHDVEINPKYGIEPGSNAAADTDLSFAVDAAATGGLKDEPEASYTSSLPGHLVCLD